MSSGDTPPKAPAAAQERRVAAVCTAAVAALGLAALAIQIGQRAVQPLGNSDVFWQVRAGEVALHTGRVPDVDPFSYTIAGEPWNNHEWLFEILAALLHGAAGWGALRLLVLALFACTALALGVAVARRAGALGPALFVLALFHALAGYKMKPVPQALSMPLMLAALHFFRGPAMLRSRARAAALVVYMLAWGNLTAEAITFLPFLFLDQICLRRARRADDAPPDRAALLLVVLASLAPLVAPPWSSPLDYLLRGTAVNRAVNLEFTPLWLPAAVVQPIAKLAARLVVLVYVPWAARALLRSRDRWATLRAVGPGLVAVIAAVLIERDLWLLVLPAAHLSAALVPRARLAVNAGTTALGLALSLAYASAVGWTWAGALRDLRDPRWRADHVDEARVPVRCVEALAAAPEGTRLFIPRVWASYAIFRLPEVRVFFDGRNLEYPREIHRAGGIVTAGAPGSGAILDGTRTDAVIEQPGWDEQPGLRGGPWRAVHVEPRCVLYGRDAAAVPAP